MDPLHLIQRLGKEETELPSRTFISPIYNSTSVITLIEGIVHRLEVPSLNPGWYEIRPENLKTAEIVGQAGMSDIEGYLKRLKKLRLILLPKEIGFFFHTAVPFKNCGLNFDPLPLYLVSDSAEPFDTIIAGFDGSNLWYWEIDPANNSEKSEYLRERLVKGDKPEAIRFKGLTLEEKVAYALYYSILEKKKVLTREGQLKRDVEHAGGKFIKATERKDHFSITYTVDGNEYTSYVSKDTSHQVLTAGICLSGQDTTFDLASLITVLREGQNKGLIHRYNNTIGE